MRQYWIRESNVNKYIVGDEALHHEMMVMLGSHIITSHSESNGIPKVKTFYTTTGCGS